MSAADPKRGHWSIHYQQAWKDDAANPRFSMPLRVAFMAFGNHRANGHANFRQEEIAKSLGHFDEEGTFVPADRRTVHRAIQQAIEWGLLEEGSRALCLIVPAHRMTGGPGNPEDPCQRHDHRGRRKLRVVR
jgi:hypothetical protein